MERSRGFVPAPQFGGRGVVVERHGGGWIGGGFGLRGAAEGALTAAVLNSLTSYSTSSIECIVDLQWKSGQVVLLNREFTPDQVGQALAPVIQRIEDLRPGEEGRRVSEELAKLATLRHDGLLSQEQFEAAKNQALGLTE